jgi:peptide/nickel transport system substrate-binding protein
VTTSGAYTVKIHLSSAFSPLLAYLTDRSGMMLSPKAVQGEGAAFATAPVGTGPFKFQDRVKGVSITLVRNPRYWRKGYPKAARVVFKIFPDANTQLVNLESSAVDFNDTVTPENVSVVQHSSKMSLLLKPSYSWGGFWLNTKASNLSDARVRRAISMAINRAQYDKVACGKTCFPAASPFGPGLIGYGSWDKATKQDIAGAKKLLTQAHAEGTTFTYLTTPDPIAAKDAALLQSELAGAGITMKISTETFPSILSDLGKHNFDMAAVGWSGRPDPDLNAYNHFFTNGPNNYGQYSNKTVDKYLNLGRHTVDPKKRAKNYEIVARQLQKDAPYIFTNHGNVTWAYSKKLKSVQYVPDGIIRAVAMTK